MANINRVVLVWEPHQGSGIEATQGGTSVCSLRVAVNTRRKDDSGQWVDKANYFDVTVFGGQGENCRAVPLEGPRGRDRWWTLSGASGKRPDGSGSDRR